MTGPARDIRYRCVYRSDEKTTERLYDVGILADGTLHNPNGYPDDLVRTAVLAAEARRHERRSNAAKKAAETRRRRRQKQIWQVAKRILAGHGIGERHHCAICGRGLDDPTSIERGIGSECWQDVLNSIEAMKGPQDSAQGKLFHEGAAP
jgi:hypothetical protein